jgi:cystine transport system substrate-binding protein
MRNNLSRCCLGLIMTSIAGAACGQAVDYLARARVQGHIRVANTQSTPPWSTIGADNQPAGYDVEIAREVVRRMGIARVVFVADTYKNFVSGLKAGKYEIVMNDLTPTPERARQVDFAAAYGVEDFRIVVRADNGKIAGTGDLRGRRVGVTAGTTNESWAHKNLPQSDIRVYDNGGFLYADLYYGRVDAVISSHFSGMKHAKAGGVAVREVGVPLIYQLSAPAIAKGQPALKLALDQAIAGMLADGTLARIAQKWVGAEYDMTGTIRKAQRQPN